MPRRLPPGIYEDRHGFRAVVAIAAGRKEKRFPPATSLKEIKRWRNAMRVKLERLYPQKRAGAVKRGTFTADVTRYLKTLAIATWQSRRSELRAWCKRVGRLPRSRVTTDHVRAAIKAWTDADVAPKTIVNRLRALTALYHALDGPDAWTPADHVPRPKLAKRMPVVVSVETLRTVEQNLRAGDPKTHARYMVLIATGCRPVHLKRAQPTDVDLERRVWRAHGAKDGNPVELWLNDDMLAAWETFIAADAWGQFKSDIYAQELRAAGWPEDVRPYNAKHTFGRELGEAGIDMQVIADWFGHTKTETTRVYVPALASRLRAASERINGRLGWGSAPPNPNGSGNRLAVDLGSLDEPARKALLRQLLAEALRE